MTNLPSNTGDEESDYTAGFNAATLRIRNGMFKDACAINNQLGTIRDMVDMVNSGRIDWVAIGFRSALTIHIQAQGQRAGKALQ